MITASWSDLKPALEATIIEFHVDEQETIRLSAMDRACLQALFPFRREYAKQLFIIVSDEAITPYKQLVLHCIWKIALGEYGKEERDNQFCSKKIFSNDSCRLDDYRMVTSDVLSVPYANMDSLEVLKAVLGSIFSGTNDAEVKSAVILAQNECKDFFMKNFPGHPEFSFAIVRIIEPVPADKVTKQEPLSLKVMFDFNKKSLTFTKDDNDTIKLEDNYDREVTDKKEDRQERYGGA